MKKLKLLSLFIVLAMILTSCKKDNAVADNSTMYTVSMTDAPGNFDAVYIDVKAIEIIREDESIVLLNTTPHIYNLLDLTNGVNVIIASAMLNTTSVKQIRLILGPNNTVVVNGVTYPLSTPSAEQSGLKLKVHHELHHGTPFNVLLDFDADKSIVKEGNGEYKLKPVIRLIEADVHGSINGEIDPEGTLALVTATSITGSYSTYVNHEGEFKLMGLLAGIYSVTVTPAFPLVPVTINNITVTAGASTNLGHITI